MIYRLKLLTEKIRNFDLKVECIENLDETIDALFEELKQTGDESTLDRLCPYFGVIWPSALGLSHFMAEQIEHNQISRDARILEVGCGLALPSLLLAKAGFKVTAIDFHPEVKVFLARNQKLNEFSHLKFDLKYIEHDWQNEELTTQKPLYDWVIGSDILYEKQHPAPVAKMLAEQVRLDGTIVLADPGRPYLQTFVDELKKYGFDVETQILKLPDRPDPGAREIFILIGRRSPGY